MLNRMLFMAKNNTATKQPTQRNNFLSVVKTSQQTVSVFKNIKKTSSHTHTH